MRIFLVMIFIHLSSSVFAQITYTYIEPDPVLEAEKRNKEAYFSGLRSSAAKTSENCLRACGHFDKGHVHDANDPDPCNHSSSQMQCECNCGAQYKSTLGDIDRLERDWQRTAQQRQKEYENRKIKEQQDGLNLQNQTQQRQNLESERQTAAQAKLDQVQQQLIRQQQRNQQSQLELDNAKDVSMNTYQEAINSGKKESGALLDATLAGAQQINDPHASLVYTGIGLGISLFTHLAEKKAQKREMDLAAQQEEAKKRNEDQRKIGEERQRIEEERKEKQREIERKQLIIDTKSVFIREALNINKYTFSDLVSKQRFASLLIVPQNFDSQDQSVYFSIPIPIPKYSDNTYPLKEDIKKKMLAAIDKGTYMNKIVYILFPIANEETFQNDFIKKMGSGSVISLNAQLISFNQEPFVQNAKDHEADFWGNPEKKDLKKKQPDKSFWEQ